MSGMTTATMVTMGIMGAMTAATTAITIEQKNQQASATTKAAQNAAAADYVQEQTAMQENSQKNAIDASERARQAMVERAQLRMAQGESGLAGVSQGREMNEVDYNQAWNDSILKTKDANYDQQMMAEENKSYTLDQGRINEANAQTVGGAMAGLQIGMSGITGGMQGYGMGRSWSTPSKTG